MQHSIAGNRARKSWRRHQGKAELHSDPSRNRFRHGYRHQNRWILRWHSDVRDVPKSLRWIPLALKNAKERCVNEVNRGPRELRASTRHCIGFAARESWLGPEPLERTCWDG